MNKEQGQESRRQSGIDVETRREMRRESRANQTYKNFLKYLMDMGDFSNEEQAEKAAVAVLCCLERRITRDEAEDLEAQLPMKLRELVQRCEAHEEAKPRRIGPEEFVTMVAEHIGADASQTVPIIREVASAVRAQISEGEWEDVMRQLPKSYEPRFAMPV